MSEKIENPDHQRCADTDEWLALELLNEPLTPAQREGLHAHIQVCPVCQQKGAEFARVHGLLSESLKTPAPIRGTSAGFSRTIMQRIETSMAIKAMPELPEPARAPERKPVAFVARPQGRRWWRISTAAAALITLSVLAAYGVQEYQRRSVVKAGWVKSVRRGTISREATSGIYSAQSEAVLQLKDESLIKFQSGTRFEISKDQAQELRLRSGDLYANKTDTENTLKVSCANFETELDHGQFFMAETDSLVDPHGILIVFDGAAHVTATNARVPLKSGEVFITVGNAAMTLADTVAVQDLPVLKAESVPSNEEARKTYQTQVLGYRAQLQTLSQELARPDNDLARVGELRERYQRVAAYLDAHQRKLKLMLRDGPLNHAQKALQARSEPAKWL